MIAVTAKARVSMLHDVQTVREAGHPALEFEGLNALFGSKHLAPAVRERIAKEITEIAADQLVAEKLAATGQVVNPGSRQDSKLPLPSSVPTSRRRPRYWD